MYRNQLDFLKEWHQNPHRKPLVVRGARQVGKSTLVRLFSEERGFPLCELNLDRHPEFDRVFETKDTVKIISEIEALPKMKVISEKSVLFLDEIQGTKSALSALRYFYEDRPDIPVVAAGSLLEFLLTDHSVSMPVGRIQYLHMGPLVFSEFLRALDEIRLLKDLQTFNLGEKIADTSHARLLEMMKAYFAVGGMPEAVLRFVKNKSFRDVSEVHQSLLDTYRDDFPKYSGSRNLPRMLTVFRQVAKSIGQKVKYASFSSSEQSATIKKDLELLSLARLISKVTHSHCNGLPLGAETESNVYKLIFLDVGLVNAILGLDWSSISNLETTQIVNQGSNAEQFVGQHLLDISMHLNNTPELFYWLREGKEANAEVDFVCSFGGKIVPIEVKSGASGTLKSLNQFMAEKNLKLAFRLDTNPPSIQKIKTIVQTKKGSQEVIYDLVSLPIYLVERLPTLAQQYFEIEN
jgi:uncharacterized protein